MYMHLHSDPFSKEEHEAAGRLAPDVETCERILDNVLTVVQVPDPITYRQAVKRLEAMSSKKLMVYPRRMASCAAGLAAVAAALLLTTNITGVDISSQEESFVAIPDERVPLAGLPGYFETEKSTDGVYSIAVYDEHGTSTALVKVQALENGSPVLDGCVLEDDLVRFVVSEELAGLQWEQVHAIDQNGERMSPVEVLPELRRVSFIKPLSSMELILQDVDGNNWLCTLTLNVY